MIIRSLSIRATPLMERQLQWHRRRWLALRTWVREEWRRSRVMQDNVQASRERHVRIYLRHGSGPRF